MTIRRSFYLLILFVLLSASACGAATAKESTIPISAPATSVSTTAAVASAETPAAEQAVVSTSEPAGISDEVIDQVVAQVEQKLASQQTSTPANSANEALATVDDLQSALVDLYQQTNPSVVYIILPSVGSGSGFVFDKQGHIVTNNHVVEGGRAFEVVFANGERQPAELVGRDVDSDLAVIQVERLPEGVQPLPLGSSEDLQVGQFVAAIGNPFGEQGSMSLGIVSGLNRSLSSQRGSTLSGSYSLPEVIQTDAPINPGNSGGPLLNLAGEVVGVNSAIASATGTNSGVGFSIPADAVKRVVPSLIEGASYDYPYMGVTFDSEVSLEDQTTFGLSQTQGAYVVGVTPGGPADQAGLRAADANTGRGGDLVVAIDGQPIIDFSDLNSYLVFHTSAGQTIALTIVRDGESLELPLTLGSRP